MMEDLIACIYPWADDRGYAKCVIESPQNESRYLAVEEEKPLGRKNRESTAPLEETTTSESNKDLSKGLQLRFSHGPKTGPGFLIGTDSDLCDIVLPISEYLPAVGNRHCYLSFDEERRLILQDRSRNGTVVMYNGKGDERRSKFKWIIGGHSVLDTAKFIIVKLHKHLQFLIEVSTPSDLVQYSRNVDKFLQDAAAAMKLPLAGLKVHSDRSTAVASELHTPHTDPLQSPILLNMEEIGSGAFGKVTRSWDVSTGIEYASKSCRFKRNEPELRREASLMARASHEHLVRFHRLDEGPEGPSIIMDYVPLGALEELSKLSRNDVIDVLIQTLSALEHLHGLVPPIVHRDIKPLNIFVQGRNPMHIKLGDFGLSKASEDPTSVVGTKTYIAPEIHRNRSGSTSNRKYTNKVDVWSLGVVVLRYLYRLPSPGHGDGLSWCKKIVKELDSYESDDLVDLLSHMLVVDPKMRYSAAQCLKIAMTLERQPPTPNRDLLCNLQSHTPQAVSESSTVKFHTRKPGNSSKPGLKRPRSLEGDSSERQRSIRPFRRTSHVEGASVLGWLREIRIGDGDCLMPDTCMINDLCRHFERLEIYQLEVRVDPKFAFATLMAITPARTYVIACFSSSDRMKSIANLAQHLVNVLSLQDLDDARGTGNELPEQPISNKYKPSTKFRRTQTSEDEAGSVVETIENRTGSPRQAAEDHIGNSTLNAVGNGAENTALNNLLSWSTLTTGADTSSTLLPFTYPSGLRDVADLSGLSDIAELATSRIGACSSAS